MADPDPARDLTPGEKFEHELSAVFVRWWEESDLDDTQMADIAENVTNRFCNSTVDFESDIDLGEDEKE